MSVLNQLNTDMHHINKVVSRLYTLVIITFILFLISIFISAYFYNLEYILVSIVILTAVLVAFFINKQKKVHIYNHIIGNIKLTLYKAINNSIEYPDADIVFADNENGDLCFLVEAYGKNVTYNDLALLASVIDFITNDINKIISPNIIVYYRIDNDF